MKTNSLTIGSLQIIEIISDKVVIKTTQDALDLMGNYPADGYIFHTHHFEADFFDLSTQKLGEILQKFTNYQVKLAVIGSFDDFPSKTLKDFIYETNKFGNYLFVSSLEEVTRRWQL